MEPAGGHSGSGGKLASRPPLELPSDVAIMAALPPREPATPGGSGPCQPLKLGVRPVLMRIWNGFCKCARVCVCVCV